ncbi:MAG: CHASE2 domain-containing protein, partial [Chloroflexi bacterium]
MANTTPTLKLSRKQRLQQGLYLGGIIAAFVLLLWVSGAFAQLRLRLSNIYFVPSEVSDTIVIIAIDDASIAEYGRFAEWPRSIYADLLDRLSAAGARVVAFDMLFDQPAEGDDALVQAIQNARAGEARTRVIMPSVGVQRADDVQGDAQAITFDNVLFPAPYFVAAVDNLGFVNVFPDVDSMIRRQPSLVHYQNETYVSFSIATYLAYKRIPASAIEQVITSHPNALDLAAERPLYVDQYGFWVQNYFGPPASVQPTFTTISLKDVLADNVDMALFDGKIVLVGAMNNVGFVDQYPVPSDTSGRPMTGVEIQANAIETLLQNRALREQSPLSQAVMIIVLALIGSAVYTQLRWYWKLVAAFALMVGWVLVALAIFSIQLEIVYLFHPLLALFLSLLGAILIDIAQEIRRRRKTEFLLESVVAIAEQRLALDSILAHIAADLRRITDAPHGAIWLMNTEQAQFNAAYVWPQADGNTFETIARSAAEKQTRIIEGKSIATPIIWQGQVLGTLVVHLAEGKRPTREMLNLLDLLARQLAPNLDNALLYGKVERQRALLEAIFNGSPAGIMV